MKLLCRFFVRNILYKDKILIQNQLLTMAAMADGPKKGVFVNPNINGLIFNLIIFLTSRDTKIHIRRIKTTNILTKTSTKALKETTLKCHLRWITLSRSLLMWISYCM